MITMSRADNADESPTLNLSAEDVVIKYKSEIFGIALSNLRNRYDADDVFQEVFLVYFKKCRRLKFNSEEHRKAWLIRTTLNLCKKHKTLWRKPKGESIDVNFSEHSAIASSEVSSEDWQFALEEQELVYSAMGELSDIYRNVLYLFYFQDLSVDRIGEILKIKPGTVRVQLKRGRELMREKLKNDYFYDPEQKMQKGVADE
jgi:RNA polymerase sigma-70 factor (ECF subfamily)